MIKAIFFDGANVIFTEGYRPGIRQVEIKHGFPKDTLYQSAHERKYWKDFTLGKITEREYLTKVTADYSLNFKKKVSSRELQKAFRKNTKPIRGILSLLKNLKKQKRFKIGIISNNPKEWFFWTVRQFALKGLFDIVAVSGITHIRKPDIRMFEYALKKAGVKPQESIYIDDRPDRTSGASKLGIHIVILKNIQRLKKSLSTYQVKLLIR